MRSDPADYQFFAPRNLHAVIALLAGEPGQWQPLAGGTDVMVLYGAGHLPHKKFVNIWNLPELRAITESPSEIQIGAAATYTDIRNHPAIQQNFPMLVTAASWTGGIANQNRGTLGGNIANASPAADSPPALLAYDADILLTSVRGDRRIPYQNFHLAYKKTALAPDELIRAIALPKKFAHHLHHARKVGARQAQAISKVSLAAAGQLSDGVIADLRLAVGSVAPIPLRLTKLESALLGKSAASFPPSDLRRLLAEEIAPIDDIRSTSAYRSTVAANLIAEFLERLASPRQTLRANLDSAPSASHANSNPANETATNVTTANATLQSWNALSPAAAAAAILPCCGSQAWAVAMAAARPLADVPALLESSRQIWNALPPTDWLEAFRGHPRIGESQAPSSATAKSHEWSSQEQCQVAKSPEEVKQSLAEGNRLYEQKFNRIFIVCATGKSPSEILQILRRRLQNEETVELPEAANQQQEITRLRLKKWLNVAE
jgi:OHCU decarboxylase